MSPSTQVLLTLIAAVVLFGLALVAVARDSIGLAACVMALGVADMVWLLVATASMGGETT